MQLIIYIYRLIHTIYIYMHSDRDISFAGEVETENAVGQVNVLLCSPLYPQFMDHGTDLSTLVGQAVAS